MVYVRPKSESLPMLVSEPMPKIMPEPKTLSEPVPDPVSMTVPTTTSMATPSSKLKFVVVVSSAIPKPSVPVLSGEEFHETPEDRLLGWRWGVL